MTSTLGSGRVYGLGGMALSVASLAGLIPSISATMAATFVLSDVLVGTLAKIMATAPNTISAETTTKTVRLCITFSFLGHHDSRCSSRGQREEISEVRQKHSCGALVFRVFGVAGDELALLQPSPPEVADDHAGIDERPPVIEVQQQHPQRHDEAPGVDEVPHPLVEATAHHGPRFGHQGERGPQAQGGDQGDDQPSYHEQVDDEEHGNECSAVGSQPPGQ